MEDFGYKLSFVNDKYTFDDVEYVKNTLDDFHLILTELYIPEPTPKAQKIDIPFTNGSLDLTEVTGITPYNDREGLEFKFYLRDENAEEWAIIIRRLSMFLHGQRMKMMVEFEPSVYYIVRLDVDPKKSIKKDSTIVLKGSAHPFKYGLLASNEPWLWDPFSFVDGIIEDTSDIKVEGSATITIQSGGVPTSPEFYVSRTNGLGVMYGNRKLEMPQTGYYKFPQITVGEESKTIEFTGNGVVSIAYRSRFL